MKIKLFGWIVEWNTKVVEVRSIQCLDTSRAISEFLLSQYEESVEVRRLAEQMKDQPIN